MGRIVDRANHPAEGALPLVFFLTKVGKCIPMVIALLRRIRMRTHLAHRQTINHPKSAIIASSSAEDVDSVTDATANLNEPLEGQAAASLQPPAETRVRLLVDTNVYLHQPLDTCELLELAHTDKVKILIPKP